MRTPGAILDGRVATCLDTSLLFAAALEQAGLNPLLILTPGHAFAGLWLQPVEFATLLTDEAAALRRRIDLSELIVFETTLATHASPPDSALRRKPPCGTSPRTPARWRSTFAAPACRRSGRSASTASHARPPAARRRRRRRSRRPPSSAFDVEVVEETRSAPERIALWQRKLLNLTTSNRLLNVPETGKIVRLVCPDPAALEDRLAAGGKVKIVPMPDVAAGGRDERLYEAQNHENLREELARLALSRGELLSTLEKAASRPPSIDLYRKARSDLEEGGANTLFLVLGALKWKKSATDPRAYRAPLVLMPVVLQRKSALSGVVMTQHEDEPRFNLTLLELLRQDFELAIPALEGALPTDGSGIDLPCVLTSCGGPSATSPVRGHREVMLGTFSFAKYLMWKDLARPLRAAQGEPRRPPSHRTRRSAATIGDEGFPPIPATSTQRYEPSRGSSPLCRPTLATGGGRRLGKAGKTSCSTVRPAPGSRRPSPTSSPIISPSGGGFSSSPKSAPPSTSCSGASKNGLGAFCLELHSAKATSSPSSSSSIAPGRRATP